MAQTIADAVEAELVLLARQLTEPAERECLRCYLLRMMSEFGCDCSYRWTIRWRDEQAPRARGLVGRLEQLGGRCDCEVVLHVFPAYPPGGRRLPCAGQPRAGSAMPCDLWGRRTKN